MKILECRSIKEKEKLKLKQKIKNKLTLAVIQIGDFKENTIYFNSKKKLAMELGIELVEIRFSLENNEEEIINKIIELNNDDKITGIMIQKPILEQFDYNKLANYIDYRKDVDVVSNDGQQLLENGIIPCCAGSILKLFEYYDIDIINKKIAVIGKSKLVGLPIYNLLKTITQTILCDSNTKDLKDYISSCDIIITAIGKPNYFDKEYFNSNQIIIDVGTNYVNGKLVGDVNYEDVKDEVLMITPVPGGIGQLTPICLYENLVKLYLQRK